MEEETSVGEQLVQRWEIEGKYKRRQRGTNGAGKEEGNTNTNLEHQSVLFVEQTVDSGPAKALRELMARIAPRIGFSVKVVERAGSTLKSKLPQSGLWDGAPCDRGECITCNQGAEVLAPCTRRSVVYGIKGIENKKRRCREEGRSFFRKAKDSMGARWRKKLLSGSNWYKGGK